MPAALRLFLSIAMAGLAGAFAQGGSAVITLVMPPPGGEGFTALQSGAALAEGATAAFYNPAALAELHRSTGSPLAYAQSRQDLIPILRLPDLFHSFQGAALVAPAADGTDIGFGFFRNHVEFGENTQTDDEGRWLGSFRNWETVWGLSAGIRLGGPLSLGVSAKFIDSHLGRDLTSTGLIEEAIVRSWAIDLGLLAMPRFRPPAEMRLQALEFIPSFALTARNFGPDVFYHEALEADPIPTTYTAAAAARVEGWDALQATVHVQVEQEWIRSSTRLSPVYNLGADARLLLIRGGWAWLADPVGHRWEGHTAISLDLDLRRFQRAVHRIRNSDWLTASADVGGAAGFGSVDFLGSRVEVNPKLSLGWRRIHAFENGIRDRQYAIFGGVSL